MITRRPEPKRRNGDKALELLTAPSPAPAEKAKPWVVAEAVAVGIQDGEKFTPMDRMVVLTIPREYRRRFAALDERIFPEAVYSLRLILWTRLQIDFPDCHATLHILQPRGDIGVVVEGTPDDSYVNDPRHLQQRLDEACAGLAACLGV